MKILITGISSFIGRGVAPTLVSHGHRVIGTSRRGLSIDGVERIYNYSLNQEIAHTIFDGVDLIIHLAWDLNPDAIRVNIAGTLKFANAGLICGVSKQIFVSSLSAHPEAVSSYARGKRECEEFFRQNKMSIVRPGLVIGDGGGFKNIFDATQKSRIIPLIDSGKNPIQFIEQSDLNTAMATVVGLYASYPEANLFYDNTITLRDLIRAVAVATNRSLFLVPVPSRLILNVVRLLESAHLPTPISSDQILGYLSNNKTVFTRTPLPGIPERRELEVAANYTVSKN